MATLLDPDAVHVHVERLFRAARALCRSPHDAEDLVQETYARALARPRLLRAGDAQSYLLRVLHNTYLTRLRTAGGRPGTVELDGQRLPRSARGVPEVVAEYRELLSAIAALPADFRDAMVAVDLVGVSYREA